MSAVIAEPAAVAPAKRGKKKLLIIAGAALAVLLGLGGGAAWYLKHKAAQAAAAAEAGDDEGGTGEHAHAAKADPKNVPSYLPLDPFVVNLADRTADRFAQIGITLELESGVSPDQIRAFMPSIRSAILMILANKSSQDLLDRSGKELLAQEIMREAVRPMGIEVVMPEPITAAASEAHDGSPAGADNDEAAAAKAKAKAKPKKRAEAQPNPIRRVHFSSFIIQ